MASRWPRWSAGRSSSSPLARNVLRARAKDEDAAKNEKIKRLKCKVGELVLDNDILKEAVKGRPFGERTSDE